MDDRLADGGAIMTAYAMMQFTTMSDAERTRIAEVLLHGIIKLALLEKE
jgi:uncharacterized membrane protein